MSAKTSWTPWPWSPQGLEVVSRPQRAVVAIVQWSGEGREQEDEANAHLISAAPELYEALQRLIAEIPSNRDWLDPVLERAARAALAKARGES